MPNTTAALNTDVPLALPAKFLRPAFPKIPEQITGSELWHRPGEYLLDPENPEELALELALRYQSSDD